MTLVAFAPPSCFRMSQEGMGRGPARAASLGLWVLGQAGLLGVLCQPSRWWTAWQGWVSQCWQPLLDQASSRGEVRWLRPGALEQARARLDIFAPSHLSRAGGECSVRLTASGLRGLGSDSEPGLRVRKEHFSFLAGSAPGPGPGRPGIRGAWVPAEQLERVAEEEAGGLR